jgi:hypothetical protein
MKTPLLLSAILSLAISSQAWAEEKWDALFEKEAWYKDHEGKETVFRGVLKTVPKAGGVSTFQRSTYYKLGERTIYTGAKRVPALDRLADKHVEIRGKAVDFELEGQNVKEIWPAAVRAAPAEEKKP